MKEYDVNLPFTKEDVMKFEIGDCPIFDGNVLTARDAAHKRFQDLTDAGQELPVDVNGQTIFYAGPCPTSRAHHGVDRPDDQHADRRVCGDDVSAWHDRHDRPSDRADCVADLCKQYGGHYLLSIGGASAMISNQVKSMRSSRMRISVPSPSNGYMY
jgi:fumarate hydratase subunit beta